MNEERRYTLCGISIPPIVLGCAYLGTKFDKEASFALLDEFRAGGGRVLDSANSYAAWLPGASGGESETVIGEWLSSRRAKEEMLVITKAGFGYGEVPEGCSPRLVEAECERSLRRLGLERVAVFMVHRMDPDTPPEVVAEALARIRGRGLAIEVGASNHDRRAWKALDLALRSSTGGRGLGALQNHHPVLPCSDPSSLAEYGWTAPDIGLLDEAAEGGAAAMAHTPLLWGLALKEAPLPPAYDGLAARRLRKSILAAAAESGEPPAAIALAMLARRERPVAPVFGASSPSQVREALRALVVEPSSIPTPLR